MFIVFVWFGDVLFLIVGIVVGIFILLWGVINVGI